MYSLLINFVSYFLLVPLLSLQCPSGRMKWCIHLSFQTNGRAKKGLICLSINKQFFFIYFHVQKAGEGGQQIDDDIKDKMKNIFIDELMRRYQITSTFERVSGTVHPFVKYTEDDLVVKFHKAHKHSLDITGEDWNPEYDLEYMCEAIKGLGKFSLNILLRKYLQYFFQKKIKHGSKF